MTTARAFIAAPLLILAYGVIRILDGLDGVRGPGLAWNISHLAFMVAMVLFVPIFRALRELAGSGRLATVAAGAGYAGIVAFIAQFGIDLVAGLLADDRAEMSRLVGTVIDIPGVTPVVYTFGPILFYAAQVALVIQLAVQHRVRAWVPLLMCTGTILPLIDKDLIPIAALCLLISFRPLARVLRVGTVATPVAAAA